MRGAESADWQLLPRLAHSPGMMPAELQGELAEGLQAVLERTLVTHTALTVGDLVTVHHDGKVYELVRRLLLLCTRLF
jgi:hypothetical protein